MPPEIAETPLVEAQIAAGSPGFLPLLQTQGVALHFTPRTNAFVLNKSTQELLDGYFKNQTDPRVANIEANAAVENKTINAEQDLALAEKTRATLPLVNSADPQVANAERDAAKQGRPMNGEESETKLGGKQEKNVEEYFAAQQLRFTDVTMGAGETAKAPTEQGVDSAIASIRTAESNAETSGVVLTGQQRGAIESEVKALEAKKLTIKHMEENIAAAMGGGISINSFSGSEPGHDGGIHIGLKPAQEVAQAPVDTAPVVAKEDPVVVSTKVEVDQTSLQKDGVAYRGTVERMALEDKVNVSQQASGGQSGPGAETGKNPLLEGVNVGGHRFAFEDRGNQSGPDSGSFHSLPGKKISVNLGATRSLGS